MPWSGVQRVKPSGWGSGRAAPRLLEVIDNRCVKHRNPRPKTAAILTVVSKRTAKTIVGRGSNLNASSEESSA